MTRAILVAGLLAAAAPALADTSAGGGWLADDGDGLARAKAARKPALIFFSAAWCMPCKELEKKTLGDPAVARELRRFVLIKIDCTDDEPKSAAARARHGAQTLPALLLFSPAGTLARRFESFVSADELLPIVRALH